MTMAFARPPRPRALVVLASFVVLTVAGRAKAEGPTETVPYQPAEPPPADASALPPAMWPPATWPPVAWAPPPPAPPVKRWYGYQIMLTDLGSIVLAAASSRQTLPLGGLGFFAMPAVIHGVHHNTPMAIASPLLRLGLPVAGLLIGASAENCSNRSSSDDGDFCGLEGAVLGMGVGLLTAMIIDYAKAFEVRPAAYAAVTPAARKPRGVSLSSAGVAPIANGAAFVLGGAF